MEMKRKKIKKQKERETEIYVYETNERYTMHNNERANERTLGVWHNSMNERPNAKKKNMKKNLFSTHNFTSFVRRLGKVDSTEAMNSFTWNRKTRWLN